MYVKHLQEYLEKFTEGQQGRRGNAVSDAKIYIMTKKGYLEEIRRMEVQEHMIIGQPGLRLVLKTHKDKKLSLNDKLMKNY